MEVMNKSVHYSYPVVIYTNRKSFGLFVMFFYFLVKSYLGLNIEAISIRYLY